MKKLFMLILIIIFSFNVPVFALEAPSVSAQGAIIMDYETGRVIWSKNSDEPMSMASTTKIMTAIMAIESGTLDEYVEISSNAASAPKVRLGLSKGERWKMSDLLYALMLKSANDAAVAVAEHIGLTVEDFCIAMTKKAKTLGAKDTVFETPNGLDKGEHHSTAYDMALIARYALANEKFREIIATPSATITSEKGRSISVNNADRLLNEYEGAIGVKTGFTTKAGHCFVGAAERNGITLISVVFASGWGSTGKEQKWRDTKKLLDFGFKNYEKVKVIDKGRFVLSLPVKLSREGSVGMVVNSDAYSILNPEETAALEVEYNYPDYIVSPVYKGQILGYAEVFTEGESLLTVDLVADADIKRNDFRTNFDKIINTWTSINYSYFFEYVRGKI
ncbi:MAG: D-alanyl-D-alanine carboxypeptidase family protein [Lachnospiraceae bacterium]|nr:D-alanyl-D-alanine carboxypeptidase family protein [Lachnospiraceae bacterium]